MQSIYTFYNPQCYVNVLWKVMKFLFELIEKSWVREWEWVDTLYVDSVYAVWSCLLWGLERHDSPHCLAQRGWQQVYFCGSSAHCLLAHWALTVVYGPVSVMEWLLAYLAQACAWLFVSASHTHTPHTHLLYFFTPFPFLSVSCFLTLFFCPLHPLCLCLSLLYIVICSPRCLSLPVSPPLPLSTLLGGSPRHWPLPKCVFLFTTRSPLDMPQTRKQFYLTGFSKDSFGFKAFRVWSELNNMPHRSLPCYQNYPLLSMITV